MGGQKGSHTEKTALLIAFGEVPFDTTRRNIIPLSAGRAERTLGPVPRAPLPWKELAWLDFPNFMIVN